MEEKILKIVKSYGFDNYKTLTTWNGYTVHTPYNSDGSLPCIGQPVFILTKGNEVRIANESEWNLFITQLDED
jgi:hypothetical protein